MCRAMLQSSAKRNIIGVDMPDSTSTPDDLIIIKKYANRRLYNTSTSSYITLENLRLMVKDGVDFEVIDAKTEEDLTCSVLTQIIFEQESKKGYNMLPSSFLRRIITFYDDSLQSVLPHYLDAAMENFFSHQEQLREAINDTLGEFSPIRQFERFGKQQMEIFENTMKLWAGIGKKDD